MFICIAIIISCLIYAVLIASFYLKKQRLKNFENKLYELLLGISIFGLILELLCCYFTYYKDLNALYSSINYVINKAFLIHLFTWLFLFLIYVFSISYGKRDSLIKYIKNNKKNITAIVLIIYLILSFIIVKIPLYHHNTGGYVYSYGPGADFIIYFGISSIVIELICLLGNVKRDTSKKYIPLYILILLMIGAYFLRRIDPGIIIINSILSFISTLMYFTIENPDVQMVNELLRNREVAYSSIQEQSNLLFNISQDVKKPLTDLKENVSSFKNVSTETEKEEIIDKISENIKDLSFVVDEILNISSMDKNKIKMIEQNYNMYSLINDIERKNKSNIISEVKLNISIDNSLPKVIYGDYLKIKQILNTLINNSIKYTKTGFIDVSIKGLIRYDVCRLVISVEDSGCGMSLDLINKYLSNNDIVEYDKMNENDIGLQGVIKVVKLLNGSVNIKSTIGKGTTIILTMDQKVDIIDKDINSLYTSNKKRILLVNDDEEEMEIIKKELSKYDFYVISTMIGKDCVDKIRTGEKYDLILLDDEMKPDNALPLLLKLKEIKDFSIPVIVLINEDKLFIKDLYIKDGFKDILLKINISEELKRIVNKYL